MNIVLVIVAALSAQFAQFGFTNNPCGMPDYPGLLDPPGFAQNRPAPWPDGVIARVLPNPDSTGVILSRAPVSTPAAIAVRRTSPFLFIQPPTAKIGNAMCIEEVALHVSTGGTLQQLLFGGRGNWPGILTQIYPGSATDGPARAAAAAILAAINAAYRGDGPVTTTSQLWNY